MGPIRAGASTSCWCVSRPERPRDRASERIFEAGENRDALLSEPDVDETHHLRAYDAAKPETADGVQVVEG